MLLNPAVLWLGFPIRQICQLWLLPQMDACPLQWFYHCWCLQFTSDHKCFINDTAFSHIGKGCLYDSLQFKDLDISDEPEDNIDHNHDPLLRILFQIQTPPTLSVLGKRVYIFLHITLGHRSLPPKPWELCHLAKEINAVVLAITEPWLDRDCHGSGTCLYIITDIAFNHRLDLDNHNLEAIWIEVLLPKTNIFTSILDSIIPIREVRIKSKSELWMTCNILDLIRERDSWL